MGMAPPWDEAGALLDARPWQQKWANQMNLGVDFVALILGMAKETHSLVMAGGAAPPLPSANELQAMDGVGG
jgi:hypothetical protein